MGYRFPTIQGGRIMPYIEYKKYKDFEKFFTSLDGQYVSPGAACKMYGITRQRLQNWIHRDTRITAHRYRGKQGDFIIIPLKELEKEEIQKLLKATNQPW